MRRPSYKEAISWVAFNDDTEWLKDEEPILSVSAALVADLFDVEHTKVIRDIRKKFT